MYDVAIAESAPTAIPMRVLEIRSITRSTLTAERIAPSVYRNASKISTDFLP